MDSRLRGHRGLILLSLWLRREKIAERMKNLQELVPNASKTDKASMLDEIIDYVKFLQLQVKVLSMSRLGAAGGAGVPLVTDIPAEESSSLLLGQEGYLQESQGTLESEKEVISLLESNVTMAMQYLQSKGLCLMPVALAAAISAWKGSSIAATPLDRRKTETTTNPVAKDGGVEPLNNTGSGIKQEDADNCSAPDAKDSKPRS
ncbi:unnamed protein product [Spirodela intermedia]|uniref:BHLH domain-containing protein n=1 Tax=Spirodela intermedia TaxID=51605 RepID=A0A7I8KD14_SPIIN|nr:unnamed protein product [Spirodela intermedia]